jgi:hypothetical protein
MAHQRSSAQARLYQVALTKRHELNDVIPAKAGIQRRLVVHNESHWVPAFAGTTLVVILLGSLRQKKSPPKRGFFNNW